MPLIIKKQPVQLGIDNEPARDCKDTHVDKSIPSTLVDKSKGIIIERYMIEITRYPDGRIFNRSYDVDRQQRKFNKELSKPAKGVTKLNISEKEVEELE